MKRSRTTYLLVAVAVICLGLASRRYAGLLPGFIAAYAGDTLWALTAFLVLGLLFPRWPTQRACGAALLFAFGVEFGQLYHAPWIDRLRDTTPGGMLLGYGFLWSDLLCYAVGVAIGCAAEKWIQRMSATGGSVPAQS